MTIQESANDYECKQCGSKFRHYQAFNHEVIKCPACGSVKVRIKEEVTIKESAKEEKSSSLTLFDVIVVAILTAIIIIGVYLIKPLFGW